MTKQENQSGKFFFDYNKETKNILEIPNPLQRRNRKNELLLCNVRHPWIIV